ncbi:hypothetical protein GCM10009426_33810 [Rheinheimera tangshanensis]|jgi:hypothetical protein|nr:hypothetical protein GCM10010920_11720 [Rheinheimera tangshanensis]
MVKNVIEVGGALTEVINIDHGCVKSRHRDGAVAGFLGRCFRAGKFNIVNKRKLNETTDPRS